MGEFISPDLYKWVYLILVGVLLLMFVLSYQYSPIYENKSQGYAKALLLGIFFIIYFGTRPEYGVAMADTSGYVARFYRVQSLFNSFSEISWSEDGERIWGMILGVFALNGYPVWLWLTVVAAIYIISNINGIRRIFPNNIYPVLLIYCSFFLFYSGGINGIRNADAYSLAFLAISYDYRGKWSDYIWMILLFIIGAQIHTSIQMIIVSFVISKFLVRNINVAIGIWIITIILSAVLGNALANIIAPLAPDMRAEKYLESGRDSIYQAGFRLDFLLFSALPIIIGWYIVKHKHILDKFYITLLNTYILTNSIWIIFIYAAFSNRFAMLSWCIYPYVLFYPFFKYKIWSQGEQTRNIVLLISLQFLFTLYMNFK